MAQNLKQRQTPFEFKGLKGVVVHSSLIAPGPIDPETGERLINPETGKPFPGKNDHLARALLPYVMKFRGDRSLAGHSVARFGVLSQLARRTPIYLYDHPRLGEICQTAFTDGVGIFIYADFFAKCVEQEQASKVNDTKFGVLPVLVHEMMHKIKYHNKRMKDIPHGIANRAQDRNINASYRKAFGKELPFIPMLTTMLEAGTEAAAAKYEDMAEEIIGRQMVQEYEQRRKEIIKEHNKKKNKQGGSSSGGGGGSSGSGQSDEFNPDDENQNNGGSQGGSDSSEMDKELQDKLDKLDEEFMGDTHHITAEEMIELLEEEGLDNVARVLQYPTSKDDKEGLEKMLKDSDRSLDRALQQTLIEMNRLPSNVAYPGAHIAEEVASTVKQLRKNKIRWKMDFTNSIIGDSSKLKEEEDHTTPVFFLKFGDGMEEIYDPALISQQNEDAVVVIFDTSASTQQGDLREQLASEMLGIVDSCQNTENAKEVFLLSGDTVLRGDVVPIHRGNIDLIRKEGIPLFGNGGTNIGNCINELMQSDLVKVQGKKIKHIIYVTDCEDSVPGADVLGEHAGKFTFTVMSTRNCYSEKWDRELTWGKVVYIENGAQASLDFNERAKEIEAQVKQTSKPTKKSAYV